MLFRSHQFPSLSPERYAGGRRIHGLAVGVGGVSFFGLAAMVATENIFLQSCFIIYSILLKGLTVTMSSKSAYSLWLCQFIAKVDIDISSFSPSDYKWSHKKMCKDIDCNSKSCIDTRFICLHRKASLGR